MTDDRKLRCHCCVEEDRVALQPRAGAASAIRRKMRRRTRVPMSAHVPQPEVSSSGPGSIRSRPRRTPGAAWGCLWSAVGGSPAPAGAPRLVVSAFALRSKAPCFQQRQHRQGTPRARAPCPYRGHLVAVQEHPQIVSPQPAVMCCRAGLQVDGGDVRHQRSQVAPSRRSSPLAARTVACDITTCQTGGRMQETGFDIVGCLFVMAARPVRLPRSCTRPWGPPTMVSLHECAPVVPPAYDRGPSPNVPPRVPAG